MIFVHLHAVIVSAALALADVTTTADEMATGTDTEDILDSLATIPEITFTDAGPTDLPSNTTETGVPTDLPMNTTATDVPLPEPTFDTSYLEPTGNTTLGNATVAPTAATSTRTGLNQTATETKPSAKGPTSTKETVPTVPSNGGVKLSAISIGLPLVAAIACLL